MSSTRLAHPSAVLVAYLEPLVVGKRVVVLGDATLGVAEDLLERGARLVHAYDPSATRVSEAIARAAGPSYAVFAAEGGVRDGAFDVAVVPDLSLFADAADVLRRVKKLVGPGVAAIASPNTAAPRRLLSPAPDGPRGKALAYYELFDAVSLQFARVKMLGQAPFVGYTVADFAPDGEPDVGVDTSLLEGSEEPEIFIAVGSERVVTLDPYAVIELPLEEVAEAIGDAEGATTMRGADRIALTEAQTRVALLGAEIEAMRDRAREQTRDAESRASNTAGLSARVMELEGELESRALRLKEIEARAAEAHVRAERLAQQIQDLEEELRRQRDRGVALAQKLDDEKRLRQKTEIELGMIRNKPEIPSSKDRVEGLVAELEAARARIAELEFEEATTRRRGATADQLEAAEARFKGLGRELEVERQKAQHLFDEKLRLVERLDDATAKLAHAEHKCVVLSQRLDAPADEATIGDLAALEQQLIERAHVVRQLQRDLRETERVGRELLADLEELRGASIEPSPPLPPSDPPPAGPVGGTDPLAGEADGAHRMNVLAATAARAEADLQAATWKISQLERDLAEARRGPRTSETVHEELEQALVAAHEEVASLRRALATQTASVG